MQAGIVEAVLSQNTKTRYFVSQNTKTQYFVSQNTKTQYSVSQNTKTQYFLSQKCRFRVVIQKIKYLRRQPIPQFIQPRFSTIDMRYLVKVSKILLSVL